MIRPTLLLLLVAGFPARSLAPEAIRKPRATSSATLDLSGPLDLGVVRAWQAEDAASQGRVMRTELCGRPTKAGQPCRNKVKGGGACWRHR